MKFVLVFVGAWVLVSCGPATSRVVFGVDPHSPPMEFLDDAQQPAGFSIALAQAAGKAGHFQVEFRVGDWDALFAGLESGRYDALASSVPITAALASQYDFSHPYWNAGPVLVVPRQSRASKPADLTGQSVGVQTGSLGAEVATAWGRGPTVVGYPSLDDAFDDLSRGRLAGLVIGGEWAARYVLQTPRFAGRFRVAGPPLTEEWFAFVVKKGNRLLLNDLNAALAQVEADGTLETLTRHWLP